MAGMCQVRRVFPASAALPKIFAATPTLEHETLTCGKEKRLALSREPLLSVTEPKL